MPEELMRGFLQQVIECVDAFSDALNYILHHYDTVVCEKKEYGSVSSSSQFVRVCCQGRCSNNMMISVCPSCCPCPLRSAKKN